MKKRLAKIGTLFFALMALNCLVKGASGLAVFAALMTIGLWRIGFPRQKSDPPLPTSTADDLPSIPVAPSLPPLPPESNPLIASIPRHKIELSEEKRKRQSDFPEYRHSGITPAGTFENFVAIDTETTGLAPYRDHIIELAAVKFRNGIPVERFHTLVNPQKPIPESASKISHISDRMVANSPTISQILPAFEKFIEKEIIVGHNLAFDLKMLHGNGSLIMEQKHKFIDTLQQSRRILKAPARRYTSQSHYDLDYSNCDVENHKLGTLLAHYGLANTSSHRALGDALATGQLFLRLCEEIQSHD